ncbi:MULTISPECIES: DegT/DnrJ/EryC1/StrS family aminotransferase [Leptospira]|uniref:GDP-perosamine synthase n=1 Tax=Leptospira interrogans serovar Bataviae TaxID=312175 RepID=A0AAP9WJS8_LEPIR|nr:DegT/DnrJ/EryC1/StrS family aminotransferase [Leptospira interrogans]EMN71108.1 putative spore coat polysaccharide biosynthesis protein SpsC [Leptospira interrogans serovar Bataviae str. UI 08561]EKR24631.1 putative spore coat polysaccharide biosynthesis protein SpsC [Leptospira interrogans serovar Bataviae str. L1111]QOI50310.1 DegT/DnrJ/EryC1/StrS family aminotransferase [Leptospira interrogans serovar Bataviae]UML83596.1 DegT/DnrJ/EryC1/StrS family aminotransferase [Leptospira interrogans
MKIPVAKPYLGKDEAQAAYDTILTGWVTQGPKVQEFEEKFAAYVGSKYAIALSNCTTALHLALIVAGVKIGDEVICPSMSYIATANSITYVGAKPIFAEVESATYNIDISHAAKLITPNTKAIIIVHQLGLPANIDAFKKLCEEHNLELIEDAACAAGSTYNGRKIGSHSDLVCFSFHPRKIITTGDGGMITTNNGEYYNRLKLLRQHGMSVSDMKRHDSSKVIIEDHLEIGYNYRLTDVQASMGIKQLERLDWIVEERRKIADKYQKAFGEMDFLRLPIEPQGYFTNWQSYALYLKPECSVVRNDLMQSLLDRGISTRRGVMNAHRSNAYKNYEQIYSLSISEDASDRSIILPLYVPMNDQEVNFVINNVKSIIKRNVNI